MKCPGCESENTQRLQVVYEHGTHSIDTTSKTVGGGHGGQFAVGGAYTSTKGASQSVLAAKAAPPEKKKIGFYVWAIIIGLAFLSGGVGWMMVGLLLISVGAVAIFGALQFNKDQWPGLYKDWQNSWVCNRCGRFFLFSVDSDPRLD